MLLLRRQPNGAVVTPYFARAFRRSFAGFQAELNRFDPDAECGASLTAPASWYTDPAFEKIDHAKIFKRNWLHVGHIGEIAEPGSYFTGKIAGQPYVVVRDAKDHTLRAFFNVCSHHAARVAEGAGRCNEFVCPYHGWTYRHDGKLRKTTSMTGIKDFRPKQYGLNPIEVETYGPLVFIHLRGDGDSGASLHEALDPLDTQANAAGGMDGLVFVKRREYDLQCNWKVFVDNYCDGGYHVPYAHVALAANIDMDSYRTELFDKISIQSVAGEETLPKPIPVQPQRESFLDEEDATQDTDTTGRLGSGAVYAFCYPNFMLNRYGPWMDSNTVIPTGPRSCTVRFDYFLEESSGLAQDTKYIQDAIVSSDRVQQEDEYLCHSVQEGLESDAYSQGRYVPRFETPMFHFHRLLHADYSV